MKIAIIGPSYPFRGGIATFSDRLAEAFQDSGETVTLYTYKLQYPGFLFPGKSQYSDSPPPKHLTIVQCINSINPFNWLAVGLKVRKERPDLIIVKWWLPFMGPCLGTILRVARTNGHAKIIAVVHNMMPHEKRIGDRAFTKYFVRPVHAFLAMSKAVLNDIGQFCSNKPNTLTPHPLYDNFGQVTSREVALKKLDLETGYSYLLFFGLIRAYKGLDLLLRAIADERLKNEKIKLLVAGEFYDDKSYYDKLIEELKIGDKVIVKDQFIPNAEVADYFNACSLIVQPYKSATQSGVTQIAYHFNKPMIVTDVGGLRDMCPDGKVGYVTNPDPNEITEAILRFFKNTDRAAMIENIIEEKQKYSWDILVSNIFELARKI